MLQFFLQLFKEFFIPKGALFYAGLNLTSLGSFAPTTCVRINDQLAVTATERPDSRSFLQSLVWSV